MKRGIVFMAGVIALIGASASAANIVEAAQQAGNFSGLLVGSRAGGVDRAQERPGGLTLFAPDDSAFTILPQAKLGELMSLANLEMLKTTLGPLAVVSSPAPF